MARRLIFFKKVFIKVALSISPSIINKYWIEKVLIDTLFEIDNVSEIFYTNKVPDTVKAFFKERKYKVQEFDNSWEEHGIAVISENNKEMLKRSNFVIALWDGKSVATRNIMELAMRKGVDMNVRYWR